VNTIDPITCDACERETRSALWGSCCWYLCWLLLIAAILFIIGFGIHYVRSQMCGIPKGASDSEQAAGIAGRSIESPFQKRPIETEAGGNNEGVPQEAVKTGWFSTLFSEDTNGKIPPDDLSSQYTDGMSPSGSRNNLLEDNFSSCTKGAFIYRVHNFPPFRGMECDHGTHLILESGEMNEYRYWQFHPVGDVEIHLADQVQVTGFTIENPKNADANTAPKQIEFYGVEYDDKFRRTQTPLGVYTYTDYKKGQQKFVVQNPSSKMFDIIELRFLNSQSNGEMIHVYRIDVHGIQ